MKKLLAKKKNHFTPPENVYHLKFKSRTYVTKELSLLKKACHMKYM